MTKAELEKEAEDYAKNLLFVYETDIVQRIVRERVRLALIDVLEPREKQIAELTEQNTSLLTSVENLNKSVQEFEAQINRAFDVLTFKRKRIAELEDKLANADYQLEGRDNEIAKLEAQIEKMKCCGNCIYQGECDLSGYEECKNFDKWEIKEKCQN